MKKIIISICVCCIALSFVFAKIGVEAKSDSSFGQSNVESTLNCNSSILSKDNNESCLIKPNSNEISGVWISLPTLDSFSSLDKTHVEFELFIDGNAGVYTEAKIVDNAKNIVDSGFEKNTWHKINFDTTVYDRNGTKCIFIGVITGEGENFYIANVKVSSDTYNLSNCFDGDILWQIEAGRVQLEGYVWVTTSGNVIVIDGGDSVDAERLLKLIRIYKNEVDAWFISHFHSDHIGALIQILNEENIYIKNLYFDFEVDDEMQTTDGEFSYTNKLDTAIEENRHKLGNVVTTKKGDVFTFDRLTFKVLNDAYFGSTTNLGNDSSVVFKVETAGKSVLFLGDLAQYGDVLIEDEYFLNEAKTCEIVQMAHHGQNGVNDSFYRQLTSMKVCLYPAPAWLFNCDALGNGINSSPEFKSLKTRALVRDLGVRYVFSSENGRVKLG